jgi:ferrous iron transport protein B
MTLDELSRGQKAVITKVLGRGAFRHRIQEMGFLPGREIQAMHEAPMKDPVEYRLMGYNVSLRRSEAMQIEVVTSQEAMELLSQHAEWQGLLNGELLRASADSRKKELHIAFVGNPNCGKTSLFNFATGGRERTGNYSGVTVEAKEAHHSQSSYRFRIIDLPGTYSFSAYSPEELYVRDHIMQTMPDVVVNVIDATNLERNLFLSTQLIDMDIRVVIALNMFDEFSEQGHKLDIQQLESILGIPVVPTVGKKGSGLHELFERVIEVYEDRHPSSRPVQINYGEDLEKHIEAIRLSIFNDPGQTLTNRISGRFLALKALEGDEDVEKRLKVCQGFEQIMVKTGSARKSLEVDYGTDAADLITQARYGFIAGALRETYSKKIRTKRRKTEIIDDFITHRFWGIPVFFAFMFLTFFATFELGQYPADWIDSGVILLGSWVNSSMSEGMLKDLIIDGIIGGVGGVIIFLPNILILYLFTSLMEDTGYMARAAFIMDKAMHRIGLHGKSFIPMLMGFGCNVPAILSTRIIENKRDRLVTMLINPFMSCSARLPVFVLLISAFFVEQRAGILFLLYFTGIMLAALSALLFKKTIARGADIPFVMELPPYRMPGHRTILKHMWFRSEQYLRKIGVVILTASIIIWALGYFPRSSERTQVVEQEISQLQNSTMQPEDIARLSDSLETVISSEQQAGSYIGRLGMAIEPVMAPLGFDWRMSVAILTGVAAKEIVVGTMGVLYQTHVDEGEQNLVNKLRETRYESGPRAGEPVFRPLVALSLMLFILIYFPCIGVVSAIRRESGRWAWALFVVVYTTGIAYLVSLAVYQTGTALGF